MGNSVDDKFLRLVEEKNKTGVTYVDHPTDSFHSWYCMSENELEIFALEDQYINPLWLAYCRYENMCGICNYGIFTREDEEADRRDYGAYLPENWTEENRAFDDFKAKRFIHEVCKIPMFYCAGYILFKNAQTHRSGLYRYEDTHDEDILNIVAK